MGERSMQRFFSATLAATALLLIAARADAQILVDEDPEGPPFEYSQDFNGLVNGPVASSTGANPARNGWWFLEAGTGANPPNFTYGVSDGTSNTGNTYSYGQALGNTERAFGTLRGVSPSTFVSTIGAQFVNNT